MIVFDLRCQAGHRFEGWFGSSDDFAGQNNRGLVNCPQCGSKDVAKAPMAPAVPRKSNQQPQSGASHGAVATGEKADAAGSAQAELPAAAAEALAALARAQAKALEGSQWVGDRFAEQSRAMHYGEREASAIHGRATIDEAKGLAAEGIPVAPLPFPVAPPDELN